MVFGAAAMATPDAIRQAGAKVPPPLPPEGSTGLTSGTSESLRLWSADQLVRPLGPLTEMVSERSTDRMIADRAVTGISDPRLVVFRPDRPNGAAVLVFPGGGYRRVVIDKEGYEFGRWLAERGFTAFVLFYRLPGEGWQSGPDTPLIDAQRAIRLVRARASAFGLDPARIATVGFSAGGHLCADLSVRSDEELQPPVDSVDAVSARPLCAATIYPVISMDASIAHAGSRSALLGPSPDAAREAVYSPDRRVTAGTPPQFLLHAADDASVPVENTLRFHAALRRAGVPAELHVFADGGHGFGLRKAAGRPVAAWPQLWRAWAAGVGLA